MAGLGSLSLIAVALAGVGALNWGLNEFINLNLVELFPEGITVALYGVIGLAGAYTLYNVATGNVD